MYLGLDLGIKTAHFAATADGANFEEGTVNLDGFPALLARFKPRAVGMEYTGRLAEQWSLVCFADALPCFILHSVTRKALNRLFRQTVKTDKADARTISRALRLWHDPATAAALTLPTDLFTDAYQTRAAWTLRALLADAEAWQKTRTAARARVLVAIRCQMPEREVLWTKLANDETPEEAFHKARAYALEHFGAEYDLLVSVPNVGPRLAVNLIAYLFPLERFNEKNTKGEDSTFRNIRRYVGYHPNKFQSGSIDRDKVPSGAGCRPLRGVLSMSGRGACVPNRTDRFARQYQRLKADGMKPGRAVYRVSLAILRVSVAVLRAGKPYTDTAPDAPPPPEPKPELPAHLVPQAEAARVLGVSRQAVGVSVKLGKLRSEEWNGKNYVIKRYLEAFATSRAARDSEKRKPKP